MRLWLAIRLFFQVLLHREVAERVPLILQQAAAKSPSEAGKVESSTPPPARSSQQPVRPARSDAVTLLAALQREARFVDIVQEPLDQYTDTQVGAAARDVLKDCSRVLERLFGLRPLVDQAEGSPIEVPAGYDGGRYRLTGNVQGEPPFQGQLVHHGWCASRCELPQWSGSAASAMVVAPIELEVRGHSGG